MDAVAFTDPAVTAFIQDQLVPLRLAADDPQWAPHYGIKWTPSLLILDEQGKEQARSLGFVAPAELIPSLLLGIGKARFNRAERPAAIQAFARIIADFPKSFAAPEAIYLNGVANYIETHDVSHLITIYDRLHTLAPNGEWAMRADPYRLLKPA